HVGYHATENLAAVENDPVTPVEPAVAALDETLARALHDASGPLTVRQLCRACGENAASERDVRAALDELQKQGPAVPAPPLNGPRFWGHDVKQRALEALRAELRAGPLTRTQLRAALGKRLKGVGSDQWRDEQVRALAKHPDVYRLPKTGRKGERLSLS